MKTVTYHFDAGKCSQGPFTIENKNGIWCVFKGTAFSVAQFADHDDALLFVQARELAEIAMRAFTHSGIFSILEIEGILYRLYGRDVRNKILFYGNDVEDFKKLISSGLVTATESEAPDA